MNLLVSACLLGTACRYNGTGCADERVLRLARFHSLIPVCPEQLGGLPTPRPPVELRDGRAAAKDGHDCTGPFQKGTEETLRLAKLLRCGAAVLKSRSPSCGCGQIYDGTFSGKLVPGNGLTAQKLLEAGIAVCSEDECGKLIP